MLLLEDLSLVATLRKKNDSTELRLPTSPSSPHASHRAACDIAECCLNMKKENINFVLWYTYLTYRVFVATTNVENISHTNDDILDCGWMTMNMHINNLHSYIIYSSRQKLVWAGYAAMRSSTIWLPNYDENHNQISFSNIIKSMEKEYPHSVVLAAIPTHNTGWQISYV